MSKNEFTPEQENWLWDLENGGYVQCKGRLWKNGESDGVKGYCCLGIASKSNDPLFGGMQPTSTNVDWSRSGFVSNNLKNLLFLRSWEGALYGTKKVDKRAKPLKTLTELNDLGGLSFKEIAEFIREYPWQVFTNFDVPEEHK